MQKHMRNALDVIMSLLSIQLSKMTKKGMFTTAHNVKERMRKQTFEEEDPQWEDVEERGENYVK